MPLEKILLTKSMNEISVCLYIDDYLEFLEMFSENGLASQIFYFLLIVIFALLYYNGANKLCEVICL